MFLTLVKRTHRIPLADLPPGEGATVAHQLDAALLKIAGFKLSSEALERLSASAPHAVEALAARLLPAVREMVGGHVRHNPYFARFPAGVPSTVEFWWKCVVEALGDTATRRRVAESLSQGTVNLLDLPSYGRVAHTYEEMVAAHADLMPSLTARVTVLECGGTEAQETRRLFEQLAASTVPLSDEDRVLLRTLAQHQAEEPLPAKIPIRENRALINAARVEAGYSFTADTVTDVLRCVAALTPGGDATLEKPTRFRSLPRGQRRLLMGVLDAVVERAPVKLADVHRHTEAWKRLGEKLHPDEFKFTSARRVFAVARGKEKAPTLAARVERAFAERDLNGALAVFSTAPGALARQMDRLILAAQTRPETLDASLFAKTVREALPNVAGRVLLGLREHLTNRVSAAVPLLDETGRVRVGEEALREFNSPSKRLFFNKKGKAWVTDETRAPLYAETVQGLIEEIDAEIDRRLPSLVNLTVDANVTGVALPLTEKNKSRGFGILPRGSTVPVPTNQTIRFFMYWLQKSQRTDYDLSVQALDANFESVDHCSFRNLRGGSSGLSLMHSGDVVDATTGATEFIDMTLGSARPVARYVVPQINVYSGESFDAVAEGFFGLMVRDTELAGRPFEPRTVAMKSDLTGKGQVALPLVFVRDDDDTWHARWTHIYLKGAASFNTLEGNRYSVGVLMRGIVARRALTVGYLAARLARKARTEPNAPATYIGLAPGDQPYAKTYTPLNFAELIPD